jgi:two-component system, NtrC family, sensor kinase
LDRTRAFATVSALLEREGHADALAEVTRALATLEAYETHSRTLADVTRSLLASEKTYRLVFSHELDPMSLFDSATGAFIDVTESWSSLYGYTREEALTMKVTDVSAEPEQTERAVRELPPGEALRVDVRWHRAKDGTVFPVELSAGSLVIEGRAVTYAVMRDITQRQNAERALAQSEASYRALIESMPDGVVVHRNGLLVYMNPAIRSMLGYPLDEDVAGRPALDLIHPDDRPKVVERVVGIVGRGVPAPLVEERFLRRDGTFLIAEVAGIKAVFDGAPSVVAIVRDVSSRKEIEAQLVMNDRLASLGRLAASVGHELNNPLAYVLGNVGFMERELARSATFSPEVAERFASYVKVVGEGARRMRDIVHDLKTLARGDGEENAPIDVQQLLDVCTNMAAHELPPGTRLVKDYRDEVSALGTETRLGQVFLNLLVNAAQVIAEDPAGDNEVRVVVREAAGKAVIEISDTGAGIPKGEADRIFEPFFTTKEGVGTGLGLSISHRIVTSAGGTITCEPRAGGGTTFRVTLPAAPRVPDASG